MDTKYEQITGIDKNLKPKSEIAKDFGMNTSTLTMIFKQCATIYQSQSMADAVFSVC